MPTNQQNDFILWLSRLEYEIYNLPKPNLTFCIDISIEASSRLIKERRNTSDIHEEDLDYLSKCREIYLHLAKNNVHSNWILINAVNDNNTLKLPQNIHNEIWRHLEERLFI
ncbi:thymidylate kinase [Candidatus Magnetoovum chiemensis]|nr:thymidylate kinase [Candidatus Magnetoovum chiemensis]